MLSALFWLLRIPFQLAAIAIRILLGVILMPLKMLVAGMLINVAMFLGLIAAVAAVVYFVVIK